jgi:hypothetical protein
MKYPYYFFIAFLFCCKPVWAQQNSTVSAAVNKTAILIGEPLQLTLEATFSKPHAPVFFAIDSLPHFEILTQAKIDTLQTANETTLKQVLTITSWDSGNWAIPAFSAAKQSTKPIAVNVTYTPTPANQEYHDIKDIIEVEKPQRQTWYWYLIGAALVLLLVLLLFPKKKKQPEGETAVPKEGAYKHALTALENLRAKHVQDDKMYFTELIQIFRTYLQQAKGIHSFQQTTDDLSRQLQQTGLSHEDLKKLTATLQLSDMVKFARFNVTRAEREQALTEIQQRIIALEQLKP